MKTEFDLNNLTDEDVRILEEALSRRILKHHSNMIPIIDRGYNTCDIQLLCAPNHDNIPRTVFAQSRQSGKSGMLWESIANLKPYLELYTPEILDQIDEEHEQYSSTFNHTQELYFSVHPQPKTGTNISVYKILREIK